MSENEQIKEQAPKKPVYYDRRDAARMVGISVETIRSWIKDGIFVPRYRVPFGESGRRFSYVFSDVDIKEMKELKRSRKAGRPVGSRNKIDPSKVEVM